MEEEEEAEEVHTATGRGAGAGDELRGKFSAEPLLAPAGEVGRTGRGELARSCPAQLASDMRERWTAVVCDFGKIGHGR